MSTLDRIIMNESSYLKSDEAGPERNSSGLTSSLWGVFTGIFSVLLLSLVFSSLGFDSLAAGFLFPGYWLLDKIDSLHTSNSSLPTFLIAYGVSSLPPALIGILIFSNRNILRISGVILLGIYAIFWTVFSFSLTS